MILKISKRIVLASVAKFFDPLGWLAPVIITAKIFMQRLWLAKLSWDDSVPNELKNEFLTWYDGTLILKNIKISRWLQYVPGAKYELYGFADASKLAYTACTYLHKGISTVHLVHIKSKVVLIKPLQTIPSLELSADFLN